MVFLPQVCWNRKDSAPSIFCTFLFEYSQGIMPLHFTLDPLQYTMGNHFRPSMATHLSVTVSMSLERG